MHRPTGAYQTRAHPVNACTRRVLYPTCACTQRVRVPDVLIPDDHDVMLQAHQADEWITLDELVKMYRIMARWWGVIL